MKQEKDVATATISEGSLSSSRRSLGLQAARSKPDRLQRDFVIPTK
jgi:hypothetical protein